MRIGLFGGTFNPIHYGHLRAALEVKEGFPLDECYFIPVAIPPHKTSGRMASSADRLEMLRLAISGREGFTVSDVELKRSGTSYSIDTVNQLKSNFGPDTELFLMLGLDAFLEIDTWKSYKALLHAIAFIVMARPNPGFDNSIDRWQILNDFLHSNISEDYKFSSAETCFVHPKMQPVYTYDVTLLDVSSSKVRKLIRGGRSPRFLIPPKVEDFIRKEGLYV